MFREKRSVLKPKTGTINSGTGGPILHSLDKSFECLRTCHGSFSANFLKAFVYSLTLWFSGGEETKKLSTSIT
jgi:hypothetical protein